MGILYIYTIQVVQHGGNGCLDIPEKFFSSHSKVDETQCRKTGITVGIMKHIIVQDSSP